MQSAGALRGGIMRPRTTGGRGRTVALGVECAECAIRALFRVCSRPIARARTDNPASLL